MLFVRTFLGSYDLSNLLREASRVFCGWDLLSGTAVNLCSTGRQAQIRKTGQVMAVMQRLLQLDHFSETFSFDDFFGSLVEGIGPFTTAEANSNRLLDKGGDGAVVSILQFPEAPKFRHLFKETQKALGGLCFQADARLDKLRNGVAMYEKEQKQTFEQLQAGVEALAESLYRLDSRVASVGQTAAKIGDHLESSDSQKNTANETVDLVRYMMYFNECPTYIGEEPPLFSDDDRVSEATAVAQKLRAIAEDDILNGATGEQRKTSVHATGHLDVAAKNLQAYCNELENRLLGQFDAASQRGDLRTMGDRAKILSQFNKGSSVMQRYVASRPMFMDFEVMNKDIRTVLGAEGGLVHVDDVMSGLTSVYKEIAVSIQAEAKIVAAVFPSPASVMSILVQRVMEQRVNLLIEKILSKPSLSSPHPWKKEVYKMILAGAYAKTKELANEFQISGCGDLNVEAFAESLFKSYREDYAEFELTSLNQLHKAKTSELKSPPLADFAGSFPQHRRSSILRPFTPMPSQQRRNSAMHSYAPISVSVVEEFVSWNEEAVARCTLLTLEPGILPTNVRAIFTCLLDQVIQYVTEGLERAIGALKEAAALRERFGYNSTTNRKVASAVATAAEAASPAGESSFRAFMAAVQSASTNMALLQRFFIRSVSRVLLAQEGVHTVCCDAIASAMAVAERAALTGLHCSLGTVLAEVERLLIAEQQVTDYKQLDESISPEPTTACSRVVVFLTRMFGVANGALDGLNREAFMTQLGYGLYNTLIQHWKRFTFDPSGGLRVKRDVLEYADCMRRFRISTIDEKFSFLGTMTNVFIVAPESLPSLVNGTLRDARDEVLRLIELRDDYKAKVANIVNSMNS